MTDRQIQRQRGRRNDNQKKDEQLEEDTIEDYSNYIGNPHQIIYIALVNNQVVGQIVLKRNWNKFAYVEDIKVDKQYRGYESRPGCNGAPASSLLAVRTGLFGRSSWV